MKKEWKISEIQELINIYRGKPELWDIKRKSYKNKVLKNSSLTEMAEYFSTTVDEIQRKIHNLRNQFNSELKKSTKTKSLQSTEELYVSKWPYYHLLLFLQSSLVCKPSNGNLTMAADVDSVQETIARHNQDTSEQSVEVNRSDFIAPNKKIKTQMNTQIQTSTHDSYVIQDIRALNEEEDQYEIFGKYVASEMRNLSSEYLRKKMKRKFQQIILEIYEEEEQISSPSQSYGNPSSDAYLDSTNSLEQKYFPA